MSKRILKWNLEVLWSDAPDEWEQVDEISDHIIGIIESFLDTVEEKRNNE
jgi:hypothetical protein